MDNRIIMSFVPVQCSSDRIQNAAAVRVVHCVNATSAQSSCYAVVKMKIGEKKRNDNEETDKFTRGKLLRKLQKRGFLLRKRIFLFHLHAARPAAVDVARNLETT